MNEDQDPLAQNLNYPNQSGLYSRLETGVHPFFLSVQSYSTEDIVWTAEYKEPATQTVSRRTVRANPKYLPACSKDSNNDYRDTFIEGLQSPRLSSLNRAQYAQRSRDPFARVNIFTSCTEFEVDANNRGNGRYNAIFGYRNESGARINLKQSQIFSRNDPIREIIHAHTDLVGENLANMNLLANQGSKDKILLEDGSIAPEGTAPSLLLSAYDIALQDNDMDLGTSQDITRLSTPIQYLREGQENIAMVVRGYGSSNQNLNRYDARESGGYSSGGAEDIMWTITMDVVDDAGSVHTFTRETRANPLFSEPCGEGSLIADQTQHTKVSTESPNNQSLLTNSANESNNDDAQNPEPTKNFTNSNTQTVVEKDETTNSATRDSDTSANLSPTSSVSVASVLRAVNPFASITSNAQSIPNPDSEWYTRIDYSQLPTEAVRVGGLDLDTYCKTQYGSGSQNSKSGNNGISGWQCTGQEYSIDLDDVCRRQYQDNRLIAQSDNPSDPYSLYCIAVPYALYALGLDIGGYCRSQYGYEAVLDGRSIYDWICQQREYINFHDVCAKQYGSNSFAYTSNPSDPYSLTCYSVPAGVPNPGIIASGNNSSGTNKPNPPITIDDDIEDETYDLYEQSEAYFGENDVDIEVTRDGEYFTGLVADIADSVYSDLRSQIFAPIEEGLNCGFFDVACKSRFGQAAYNAARIVVSYYAGMLKAVGDFIVDTAKLIWDVVANAPALIQGMMSGIMQMIRNPNLFVDAILGEIEAFANADIYGKAEKVGYFIGQFIPDIIIGIATGGASVAAAVGTKVTQALDKASDFIRQAQRASNLASKFVNKALFVTANVTINVVKIGNRIVMKGLEVWNKIQELPARAMNKLLKTMVNGPVKEAVEKVSVLFRTFCKSTAKVATSGLTTGLVGLALISGGINVEAKGGTCTITGNRARGIQAANKMIAKIKANNPNWEYIGTEFPVVDGTNKRVFDGVFRDERGRSHLTN